MIEHLFVIGIGGTGAKAVRSFVHLCAMGLGPKCVEIFLIDLDTNNGDVQLTKNAIETYKKIKERLEKGNSTKYFKTDMVLLTPEAWSPLTFLDMANNTLGGYLTFLTTDKKYRNFEKLLFSDDELNVALNNGCKAHPNIGSFLMAPIFKDIRFTEPLKRTFQKENSAIFVFNSIFGGTGAAGGPVIIKGINEFFIEPDQIKQKQGVIPEGKYKRIPVGASIFMPYFIVPECKDKDELLKIKSETFEFNAAGALPFFKDSVPADSIYVLGDQHKSELKDYASGNKNQKNPSHMLEFFGGICALDFCQKDFDLERKVSTIFNMITFGKDKKEGEEDDRGIYFEDLPELRFENIPLEQWIINFHIFDLFYRYFYNQYRELTKKHYMWLYNIARVQKIDLNDKFLEYLKTYLEMYHEWIEQMSKNNAPLRLFKNLDSVDNLLDKPTLEPLKNMDCLYRYLNIAKVGKSQEVFTNILNLFNDGINAYINSRKS